MYNLTYGTNTEVKAPKENLICHIWHNSVLDAALKAINPLIYTWSGWLADSVGWVKFFWPDSGNKTLDLTF